MKMETNYGRKLKSFMKDFLLSEWEMENIYKRFISEIDRGLSKETHAQADIKCFVTYVHDLPTGDEVGQYLALDLGGTNFRVLLVNLKGHHEAHIESKIYAIPQHIMTGPGTQLFDHIAECLARFMLENSVGNRHLPLGFTFSFPLIQMGLTKGLLVRWTKGFQCAGVENEDVVQLLQEAIERRGDIKIDVMGILNDATGTLMSCAHRSENCKIGVIIGTGCNACYMENVKNVDFLETPLKEKNSHVLINTEWGAFGDSGTLEFLRTDFDRIVDSQSLNAGHQLFEKMISGMYLGEIVRLVLLKAIDSELLFVIEERKDQLVKNLSIAGSFETRFISDIETDNFLEFTNSRKILNKFGLMHATVEDCQKLKFICECVTRRAANLVAIGLSGLINKMNEPEVTVGVDGSVYRYHPKFCQYMNEGMKRLVMPGIQFQIMLSEDGSGRGAALVAAVASKSVK